ncbi:MAG: cadherin-like domain-containing protein [Burkholderiaceae bacterium]
MSGALSFLAAPGLRSPADTGADNVYDVTVQADDGAGRTDTQAIAVSVTPVNDNPPVITSDGGGASASLSVAENATAVTTVTATDADRPAQAMNYSIVRGPDRRAVPPSTASPRCPALTTALTTKPRPTPTPTTSTGSSSRPTTATAAPTPRPSGVAIT